MVDTADTAEAPREEDETTDFPDHQGGLTSDVTIDGTTVMMIDVTTDATTEEATVVTTGEITVETDGPMTTDTDEMIVLTDALTTVTDVTTNRP